MAGAFSHHQAPYRAPWIPAALGKHITYWLRDDLLTLFFLLFFKTSFSKVLGNTLIMPDYWYLWKHSPHFGKNRGVPTMLVILSLPFIITPFIYLCHLHRKIATINQLIKIDSPSINYSSENEITLTY